MVGALYRTAWPILLSNELATLTTLITLFWLGRLAGTEGLGVFALIGPVELIAAWFMGAVSTGNGALVAQSVGAGDGRGLKLTANALAATIAIAGALILVGLIFRAPIVDWLARDLALTSEVRTYFTFWLLLALPALSLSEVLLDAINATGWTRFGLVRVIADLCLLALLTPVAMTIAGVGGPPIAAGIAGFALAFVMGWTMLRSRARLQLGELDRGRLLEPGLWPQMLAIGLSPQLARVATFVAQLILVRHVAADGELAVAGYGLAFNSLLLVAMLTLALAQANAIMIGQSLGAKRPDRALLSLKSSSLAGLALVLALILVIPFLCPLVKLFAEDPPVVEETMHALSIMRWGLLGLFVFQILLGAYTATAHNKAAGGLVVMCEGAGVAVALLSDARPLTAVAIAFAVANGLKAAALLPMLGHGFFGPLRRAAAESSR